MMTPRAATVSAMTDDGSRIAAAMQTAVDSPDRTAAWHLVDVTAADWSRRPLTPDDGYPDAEIDTAAATLGLPLPTALREAYHLFGRRDDLTRNQDPFCTPSDLYVHEGALIFRDENQGCCWWGILTEDLHHDDPPTHYRPDLADKREERWSPWTTRLSLALAEMVLTETLLDDIEHLSLSTELGTEIEDLGLRPLPPLLPEWYKTGFQLAPNLLAHISDEAWITLRARTPEALPALHSTEDDE